MLYRHTFDMLPQQAIDFYEKYGYPKSRKIPTTQQLEMEMEEREQIEEMAIANLAELDKEESAKIEFYYAEYLKSLPHEEQKFAQHIRNQFDF